MRFTVRRMMVVVALVAVAIVGGRRVWVMYQWSHSCQESAALDEQTRVLLARSAKLFSDPSMRKASLKQAEWFAKRRDLCKRAAMFPWTTIPNDKCPSLDELMKNSSRAK